jgi:hypothetical protein
VYCPFSPRESSGTLHPTVPFVGHESFRKGCKIPPPPPGKYCIAPGLVYNTVHILVYIVQATIVHLRGTAENLRRL